jgi:hypothetical protein
MPLIRQYISDVYESKFFVNVQEADVNIHGIAPYMPPSLRAKNGQDGLAFQIWSDPTCDRPVHITVKIDVLGSFGKLWMRYRTIFATFPLLIIAVVMSKQFMVYDESGRLQKCFIYFTVTNSELGVFMSFTESLNQCLEREIPILFTLLIFFAMYLSGAGNAGVTDKSHWFDQYRGNATETISDYTMNNLLIGSPDPFFWFLIPVFGVIAIGLCIVINYVVLAITHSLAFAYSRIDSR